MISGAFSQNNNAVRSQGQLGVACLKQERLNRFLILCLNIMDGQHQQLICQE
jgi:hypothetical protein